MPSSQTSFISFQSQHLLLYNYGHSSQFQRDKLSTIHLTSHALLQSFPYCVVFVVQKDSIRVKREVPIAILWILGL